MKLALGVALLATAAAAQTPRPLTLQIDPLETCAPGLQPAGWRDVSNPWVFLRWPTVGLGQQETSAANLEGLVSIALFGARPVLLFAGMPLAAPHLTLRYAGAHTGWTLRWPNC